MKLAIFSPNVEASNGWGNFTLNFCAALQRKEIDFSLIIPEGANISHLDAYDLEDKIVFSSMSERYWRNIQAINLDGDYDAVVSMTTHAQCVQAMRTAKRYQLPYILGIHGTLGITPFFARFFNKLFFKKSLLAADLIWSPSSFTKSSVASMVEATMNNNSFRKKMHVIHCGVEFDAYNRYYKQRPNNLELVSVGHVKRRKGLHYTLEALKILKDRGYNEFHYTIIGPCADKAYLDDLHAVIKKYDLETHITFTGEVSKEVLLKTISDHNIYIHTPGNYGWNFEGFGIVYLEANAMGLPVIGSNSGGVSSAVLNRFNGLLVEEGDADMIAQALLHLSKDKDLYQELSLNGVEWARQHDWNAIVEKHIVLYKQLIKHH